MKILRGLSVLTVLRLEKLQKSSIFILLIVVFVLLNLLVSPFSLRLDLSRGKAYTLSSSSKKIIKDIDDIVTLKFFSSSTLPTRLAPLKTDIRDLLDEYQKQGSSKIMVKVLDPKKDETSLKEAQTLGLPELQFSQIEQDKYAVSATYFGISVQYGDKRELIPQATNIQSLEYDITSVIYKITRKDPLVIAMMGDSSSPDPEADQLRAISEILSQQFEIRSIASEDEKIDATTIKTLLVFDKNSPYSSDEASLIKNYLSAKGKAVFVLDGVSVSEGLTAQDAQHNLFSLLKEYGVTLEKNFVLSESSEVASFSTGEMAFFTPYPFWVKTTAFDNSSSLFSGLSSLSFPWVSSITTKKVSGVTTKILGKSEKNSWKQKEQFMLAPQQIPPPQEKDMKQFDLIVEAEKKDAGQFILIPSSRFVKDQFLTRGQDNVGLILNVVNTYASGGALSGIRSRAVSIAPLKNIPENTKDIVKYGNIFFPLLFGIFGAMRLLKRR